MKVQRFIQPTLSNYMSTTPVVILEGARAVGKTWLLRELQLTNFITSNFSLTDPTQLAAASTNPLAWLRTLPTPFGIDEAQLLPELPLALKALLDERGESFHCILTGSAAIGQTGLGGTDPLARRSARLTLEPLTEAELLDEQGSPWSVIDHLFDGLVAVGARYGVTTDHTNNMIRGGLPRYRIMNQLRSDRALHRQIEQDINSILTENVLPETKNDSRIAKDVLTHLLMHPGAELNTSAISRSLSIDTRTINRYIDILERRFLVDELPNFHRPTKKSSRSTAKCYPADTALSGTALLTSGRTMEEAATRGGMMESHVVQQLRAHIGWSNIDVSISHWRENKNGRTSEVDIILEDTQGRLVAIEVKSAGTITSSHFKGIRAFRNYYGDRFHRGFVISHIEQATAFDDDLWALPLNALYSLDLWQQLDTNESSSTHKTTSNITTKEEINMSALEEAQIFISYSHQDQESNTGGDIRKFATDVVDALDGLYGRTVKLFLDVKDVGWGENLWSRLDQELQSSTFLMPFISPRYLKSDSCRQEFTRFSDATQRNASEQLLLPLIWIAPPALSGDTSADPIVTRLRSTLHLNVTSARRADPGSAEYGNLVEMVAERLEKVITEREAQNQVTGEVGVDFGQDADTDAQLGLDELLANVEELMPQTQNALETFVKDFTSLGESFKSSTDGLQMKTPTQLRAEMVRVSNLLKVPNLKLTESARTATRIWDEFLTNLNRSVSLYSELEQKEMSESVISALQDWADQLEELDYSEIEGIAHQMPKLSSKLVPTSKALLSAVGTLESIENSIRSWLSAVGR